ncbi:uncharacterized protein K460DRAFT_368287 [Cucurbitaria berberidis CBS 394.84]|uniref:Extracellular mutant protein 11 C-terminal domain-containing protein n=1 Tax=Cucurbitaria berberidis CBS 394.84 TaxID=1168544 RepID=A0A9P4GDH7_9PLEO|nr:uncharacterized protein K460DRAFT_368287 [Cucurbitaria berberidis CBS 394.84]KAF1843387.1 hypothetical protein K460DRAFT_368287 [Cucurbitaria berberidis CBS 394.84]
MQNFVKDRDRAASPQNGQPIVTADRQAIAANAKISLKKVPIAQQPQVQPSIPSRGFGNAQNSSAVMQQHRRSRQPGQGQGQKRDPYDTDAESLDTTVNHSITQVEDSQKKDPGHHQQQGQIVDVGEESGGDEEASEEEEEEEEDFDGYVLTQENLQLLEKAGLRDYSREAQIEFLQQTQPYGFGTIDGDSYPTTTNGDPTEWEGGQEPPSEIYNDRVPTSPSPQRVNSHGQLTRPIVPQLHQQEQVPKMFGANRTIPKSTNFFHQSAKIRSEQRSTPQLTQRQGQGYSNNAAALPASLPPTYSQANKGIASDLPVHSNNRQNTHAPVNRPPQLVQREPSGYTRVQLHPPKPHEPAVPLKSTSSTRARVQPVVQQQPVEPAPLEYSNDIPASDYDDEKLFAMKYDDLKNESFDKDPRAGPPALTNDMLRKPLVERLQFVHENFDAGRQSHFFSSLPTTEWEDAGDWFLDQFQSIIKRTKEARQSKRKLAHAFEDEIERRHMHVSKKQHQVEEAMEKMKMQGEGMMHKSPRASKSPKPKRG